MLLKQKYSASGISGTELYWGGITTGKVTSAFQEGEVTKGEGIKSFNHLGIESLGDLSSVWELTFFEFLLLRGLSSILGRYY